MAHSAVKHGKIASVFALLSALVALAPTAYSQSAAENIRPVSKVCMAGQPCVGSKAGAAMSATTVSTATTPPATMPAATMPATTMPATTAMPAAAAAAVADAVEEVFEEVQAQAVVVAAAATGFDAAAKYQQSCFACHASGAAGAPKLDDKAEWETRMAKGMDAVMVNVMNGIKAMPAKGLCMDCSESDLVALVEYMTTQ